METLAPAVTSSLWQFSPRDGALRSGILRVLELLKSVITTWPSADLSLPGWYLLLKLALLSFDLCFVGVVKWLL